MDVMTGGALTEVESRQHMAHPRGAVHFWGCPDPVQRLCDGAPLCPLTQHDVLQAPIGYCALGCLREDEANEAKEDSVRRVGLVGAQRAGAAVTKDVNFSEKYTSQSRDRRCGRQYYCAFEALTKLRYDVEITGGAEACTMDLNNCGVSQLLHDTNCFAEIHFTYLCVVAMQFRQEVGPVMCAT